MNKRVTPRERGLLKGAVRRVFARSDLRRQALDAAVIEHADESRPRVKKWCRCAVCEKPTPKYLTVVDHLDPVIPTDSSFEAMGLDKTVDRTWCDPSNLQPICPDCHKVKSASETKARKANKKGKK